MDENSKAMMTIEVTFDDLIAFDCVTEELSEIIKQSVSYNDQTAIRRWRKTIDKFRINVEDALEEKFQDAPILPT